MNFVEFLSPLLRRKWTFLGLFIILSGLIFGSFFLLPPVEKTTVYFSVKPTLASQEVQNQYSLDPVEASSKVAEAFAGWAQNPAFRDDVLQESGVYIEHFKRKLTARRQNRVNVFWTMKLWGEEVTHAEKVTQALITTFNKYLVDFNEKNTFPFEITEPKISGEMSLFPLSWILIGSIFVGFILAFGGIYLWESFTDRLSFVSQIYNGMPEGVILRVNSTLGTHDANLIEQFVLTFESPRLISTFRGAEKFFSLAPTDSIDEEIDVPVLLVRLGETRIRDLENLVAIFGDEVGIIVFEK